MGARVAVGAAGCRALTPPRGASWAGERPRALLFNGLAFDGVERELDGSIVVSAEKNAALLERIEAQLPGALALYRDADGDGRLSMDEERAGPLSGP